MTNTETVEFATEPDQLPALFMRAYNAGDIDAVSRLYEPDAAIVPAPGHLVAGADRVAAMADFLTNTPIPITITVREVYVCGDLALLLGDHVMEGTGPDGNHMRVTGTATDVLRRGADGHWRYVIDNPWGTDPTQPS
jgi:uncharacterized protein (TIGR02246 family)